jgi:urease accessory protein
MQATARLVAQAGPDGRTALAACRSAPPLVLRRTGTGGPIAEVHLVGGAAGPLGGDRLRLEIEVGPGAWLILRTVAASVALPGPAGAWSRFDVRARVAAGGGLAWLPEPLVVVGGCRHRMSARVEVADAGQLTWRDELVWGRYEEPGGDVVSSLTVSYAGRELLAHELALGPSAPGWDGPAVLAGARAAGSVLLAGHQRLPSGDVCAITHDSPGGTSAVLRLAGAGVLVTAVAPDALTLRRRLAAVSVLARDHGERIGRKADA